MRPFSRLQPRAAARAHWQSGYSHTGSGSGASDPGRVTSHGAAASYRRCQTRSRLYHASRCSGATINAVCNALCRTLPMPRPDSRGFELEKA
eukprot:2707464-Rhodomonas_salina.1